MIEPTENDTDKPQESVGRNWPIIIAIAATFVIAYQIAKYKGMFGETNKKDPVIAAPSTYTSPKGPDLPKGWIGFAVSDSKDGGCIVVDVFEGSPAAQEGIEKGDLILMVGSEKATQERIMAAIRAHSPGYELEFEIRKQDGTPLSKFIKIGINAGIEALCAHAIAVATSGLASLQHDDGRWPHYLPNPDDKPELRSSMGTTALACAALALAGKEQRGEDGEAAYEKGMASLAKMIAADGGIDDPADKLPHRVYANSFYLLALAKDKDKYPKELASVREWLARSQVGGEGWDWVDPLDGRYGGWAYHAVNTNKTLRVDVSVTAWALDALAASGLPSSRVEWSRAARYLERCQNRELHSRDALLAAKEKAWRDGGFAFSPRYSKAGREVIGPELEVYRSYGSATADGLRGLIAVSVDDFDKDAREAALQWLARNYNLNRNPGFGDSDMSGWSAGVYFYWLASMARALDQAKVDKIDRSATDPKDVHAWPDELARRLANFPKFYDKHVFASANDQMHEDSPTTSTAFAIIALCAARDRAHDRAQVGQDRVVVAKPVAAPPRERELWKAPDLSLVEKGRRVFHDTANFNCTSCHQDKGDPNAPSLLGVADRYFEWKRTRDDAKDYLKHHIREPEKFPGTHPEGWTAKMPGYPNTPDDVLDALVEFLLSRTGNAPVSEAR